MKNVVLLLAAWLLGLCAVEAQKQSLTVSDVHKSDNLSETRGNETESTESLYGEWWLVGWNDKGTWVEVDTNYVSHQHLSIELKEEDYVMAYSMVNEIFVGLLTLNGNEMQFSGEMQGMSTYVGCSLMENQFFEDYICDIKFYQLEGKQLRLYYTDSDYFVFTKDFDDSEEFFYEWKNGPVDPFIGEVTAVSDNEIEVKIIQSPSYVTFYSRTVPPMGNREICHFASSDLAGLSFEVGDKAAFRIVQFQRQNTSGASEYQLKVESCKGSEHVAKKTGTMHNDRRMGWIIIDDEVNKREGGIYYYPLKVLPEAYLIEGLPVTFSGELFLTWRTPWDNKGHSDCYYMSIDALAHTTYYYHQGNKIPLTLNENKVVISIPKDCCEIIDRFKANIKTLGIIKDTTFDIYIVQRSEYDKLTTLDFWAEDAKSVILTSSYFTENNEEVYATPYLNVRLKKEEDVNLLTSYAEQYKLTVVSNSALMPLWYILHVTPDSEKSSLVCANELYESGDFAEAIADFTFDALSQKEYHPFVEDNKVWKVGSTLMTDSLVKMVDYYYFEDDTIVNGKTCKQMMCQRFVSPDYPGYDIILQYTMLRYVGAWYEENKKVYAYDSISNQFKLMYDFSLDANDTLQINGQFYVVGPRQTGGMKGFKGVYRDVWECGDGESIYQCAPWLEGVGGIYAPPTTNVFNVELEDPAWFLMSCAVGDEVIYLNDEYEDGVTPEGENAPKRRFDFTHTVKTQPKVPMRREAEQSLYGEYNNLLLDINLNPLSEAYLVRITDETGNVFYEKAINAGNIVALNVDISGYAAGLYTVIVENSSESFTGEFEVQTTGIRDALRLKNNEEIKNKIYNLQGQRLSTLQKGLNIVNGKKVYVK